MKQFIRFILIAAALLAMLDARADARRVLPLDHGPRAQSTPWVNAQIREREERAARETQQAKAAQTVQGAHKAEAEAASIPPAKG